ncbi:hypothetical protein BAE44_0004233 [Dichanthelium oligosanthes]|uniref:Uncharacterized protein n=1 Tax=Dichanthelium oligosanthes TaxID=888268 RepID=A0A1E5WBE7_9POAL|nr:hypothetical protein BAE44_0004233 [Dichanthelium oligosanthes]
MAMTARTVLLLVVLVHVLGVLAAAARPLEGDARTGGWLESGIGMVTQLLRGAKYSTSIGKAMTARMVKAALLLLLVVQVLSVLAAATRPLVGDGMDGLLEDGGIGMVRQILGAAKSGPNPPTHCC